MGDQRMDFSWAIDLYQLCLLQPSRLYTFFIFFFYYYCICTQKWHYVVVINGTREADIVHAEVDEILKLNFLLIMANQAQDFQVCSQKGSTHILYIHTQST